MRILMVIGTGATTVWDMIIPARYSKKENKEYSLFTEESVEVPRMGPGESYTGVSGEVITARRLLVKRGPYLRGPADDVTLCQYEVCNMCQSFGDAVCVTAPATAVCSHKRWCRSHTL